MNRERPVIVLFSASPRRADILSSMGIPFRVMPADTDESIPRNRESRSCGEITAAFALKKLKEGLTVYPGTESMWGMAADTLIETQTGILGKPPDIKEAEQMLEKLSGKVHFVHTSVSVYSPEDKAINTVSEKTRVLFKRLSSYEIKKYLETGEWDGAAGAYRIQGKGSFFIREISGLYSTVMGLPINPVYGILTGMHYPVW